MRNLHRRDTCKIAPELLKALETAEYWLDGHGCAMAYLRGEGEAFDNDLAAIQATIATAKRQTPI